MASEDFIEKLNRFFFDNITRKYKNIAKVFFFFGLGSFLLSLVFLWFDADELVVIFIGIGISLVPSCWFLYGLADLLDNVHHIRLEMTRGFVSNERSTAIDQLPRL